MIFKITLNAIVWTAAIGGIVVMKKIQSGDKLYPVWAIFVATLHSIYTWFGGLKL